jgi:PilZ domain
VAPPQLGGLLVEAEQRRYPRVIPSRRVMVAWQSGTRRTVSYLGSIALGGLFVLTQQPAPLSSMVKLLMDLPFGEVRARGVVRRITPARGMAIEFVAMTQEDRGRLNKALQPMFELQ